MAKKQKILKAPGNQPKKLNLADLSDTQIKSLIYDQIIALENSKRVIQVLEDELKRRQSPLPPAPVKQEEKKEGEITRPDNKKDNGKS